MGRIFSIVFSAVAVTATQDFFSILPATQKPVKIHAVYLAQTTDVGDAQEEMLRIQITRGNTTTGSGGSAVTPRPMDSNDTASGATCRVNDTTPVSAGTAVILHSETFNIRTGFVYVPTPEARVRTQNAEFVVVQLMANPNDSITMSGTCVFEEV